MQFKSSSANETMATINIAPIVDVMLVLLIIFMVTAPMLQEGIDINLPEVSAGGVASSDDDFVLSIQQDGAIFLNENSKEKFSIQSIEQKLMETFKDRAKKEIFLKADKDVSYGYVVTIMGYAQRAGIEKVGMITNAPENEDTKH